MRRTALAALAALLTALLLDAGFDRRAGAQPAEPDSGVTIDWEVKNRFRLFRRESDFQRHVIANRAGSQSPPNINSARHRGARLGTEPGRSSLRQRRGHAARHLRPRWRARELSRAENSSCRRAARRRGAGGRHLQLELRRRHHPAETGERALQPAGRAASCPRQADHRRRRHHAAGQQRRQRLGRDPSPRPADRRNGRLGRRRRRQSGPAHCAGRRGLLFPAFPRRGARRIFPAEPARLQGRQGLRRPHHRSPTSAANGTATPRAGCPRHATARCTATIAHRPCARDREQEDRRHLPAARVHRATIENGLFVRKAPSDCPPPGPVPARCRRSSISCRSCSTRLAGTCRAAGSILFSSPSAPTTSNSRASSPTSSSTPASNGHCSAKADSSPPCRRRRPCSSANTPIISRLPQLAEAAGRRQPVPRRLRVLRPPGPEGGAPCPGGRDGLDIHPAFNADETRLKNVTDFVLSKFLPKVKALARCEAGSRCANPDTDRMTFVDAHQAEFADHGICARSNDDPQFDIECFSAEGRASRPIRWREQTSPLVCPLRPERISPLRAARTLDPHRQRQLFHGDDLSARIVVNDAAEQHPRRELGRDVGGLWRRLPIRAPRVTR